MNVCLKCPNQSQGCGDFSLNNNKCQPQDGATGKVRYQQSHPLATTEVIAEYHNQSIQYLLRYFSHDTSVAKSKYICHNKLNIFAHSFQPNNQ